MSQYDIDININLEPEFDCCTNNMINIYNNLIYKAYKKIFLRTGKYGVNITSDFKHKIYWTNNTEKISIRISLKSKV